MASNSSRFRSIKTLLLNQPSLLLLGLSTILAFVALTKFTEEEQKWLIYVAWGSIFLFILLWRVLRWYLSPADFSQNKDVIDILVKITGGAVVVLTIYFSWINFKLTQATSNKTLEVSEQTLESSQSQKTNEQFTKALEDLGGSTLFHHLAGIYSFRRLDQEIETEKEFYDRMEILKQQNKSAEVLDKENETRRFQKKIHWEIMDILTHFIQEKVPIPRTEDSANSPNRLMQTVSAQPESANGDEDDRECPVDIYEILKLIGERKLTSGAGEVEKLNLVNTDLRGCTLRGNFQDASFENVNFSGAKMQNVSLQGANLKRADFSGAVLEKANLTSVKLEFTSFYGVDLTDVRFGEGEDLNGALVDSSSKCPRDFRLIAGSKCERIPNYHFRR